MRGNLLFCQDRGNKKRRERNIDLSLLQDYTLFYFTFQEVDFWGISLYNSAYSNTIGLLGSVVEQRYRKPHAPVRFWQEARVSSFVRDIFYDILMAI